MTGMPWWTGAACGALLGLGLALVVLRWPAARQPGLQERLAPYLRDAAPPSGRHARPDAQRHPVAALAAPIVGALASRVDRVLGGTSSVRRRLQRAGRPPEVESFRAEQVVWGAVGGLIGLGLGVMAMLTRGAAVLTVIMLVLTSVGVGVIARDQWLTREAQLREARMLAEFPTVAELLALAVSAGEGATGALDRVCRLSHGELATELGRCLADARAGANLPTALQGLADRTGLPSLARFVDGLIVAVERGTPLAEVLRAQAQDVRETGRRTVMEIGGRKEIAMMIPVVFLVLPVTVLFAVFPGFTVLRLTM